MAEYIYSMVRARKAVGEKLILDDVTFHVRTGDRWVVLGANGSGKSTLLRIAAVYEHPSHGTVKVLGETLGRTDVRVLRRRVGYNSVVIVVVVFVTAHGVTRAVVGVPADGVRGPHRADNGDCRGDDRE